MENDSQNTTPSPRTGGLPPQPMQPQQPVWQPQNVTPQQPEQAPTAPPQSTSPPSYAAQSQQPQSPPQPDQQQAPGAPMPPAQQPQVWSQYQSAIPPQVFPAAPAPVSHPGGGYGAQQPPQAQYQQPQPPAQPGYAGHGYGRKPKKWLVPAIALLVVLLVGGAGAYAYMSMRLTPQKRFEKAVIKNLDINTLKQGYDAKVEGGTATLTGDFDFSDPAKSKMSATLNLSMTGASMILNAICTDTTTCYGRFTKLSIANIGGLDAVTNKWFKIESGAGLLGGMTDTLIKGSNTVLGEVVTGHITGDARNLIIQKLKAGELYDVTYKSQETIGGKKLMKYSVSAKQAGVSEVNKKVAEQYKLNASMVDELNTDPHDLYIDPSTNDIVQVTDTKAGQEQTTHYSDFNKSLNISAPANTVPESQIEAAMSKALGGLQL